MKFTGLLLLLLFVAGQVSDQGQVRSSDTGSGTQLIQRCQTYFEFLGRTGAGRADTFERDPFGMGYCAGLIRATAVLAESLMPNRICFPPNTTGSHAVWVVVQYLEDNPSALTEQDTELVLRALENSFRCP
ncbi:MAG: Rap1a/Tai family immunity protein [Acidobacteriota bacterium]|nr:Rap1a/Tai family immunity protein [Acidobacteriota bacterium]